MTASDGIGAAIRISGLSAWLASNNATSYNITLLLNSDQAGGSFATYTAHTDSAIGAVIATAPGVIQGDGTWDGTQNLGTDASAIRGDASFANLTADAVTVTGASRNGSVRGSIAGFLVTAVSAVPEPSTYGLLGAGALAGLAFARRRKRRA